MNENLELTDRDEDAFDWEVLRAEARRLAGALERIEMLADDALTQRSEYKQALEDVRLIAREVLHT